MVNDTHNNDLHQPGQEDSSEQQSTHSNVLQHELDRYKDQIVRVTADLTNYKKRVEKERSEWALTAQLSILAAFLPVIEDLNNALMAGEVVAVDKEKEMWLDGFKLIHKKMFKTLADLGVQEIDCSGDFDPHFHEALMQIDSADHASGQIVQVLSKGYLYKGEVVKHAQVSVAR